MDVSAAGPWAVFIMVVVKTIVDLIKWWKEANGKSAVEKDQAAIRTDIDLIKDKLTTMDSHLPEGFSATVATLGGTLNGIKESLGGVNRRLDEKREASIKMLQNRNQHLETEFREKTGTLYERQLEQAATAIAMASRTAAALEDYTKTIARIEPKL